MGAGFIYGLATLKIPNMQLALERAGYQLLGFAPGYDREMVAPGVVKRVYEAFYAKILVPDEELLRPDPKNLTPKAKALPFTVGRASTVWVLGKASSSSWIRVGPALMLKLVVSSKRKSQEPKAV